MSLNDSLGEDSGVLSIEEQVDSGQLNVLLGAVPVAHELLALAIVGANEDFAPVAGTALMLAQALARDGRESAVRLVAVGDPLLWQPAVVLRVVEGLQREPVGGGWLRVGVVDAL